jgi:hypothetical protein
MEHNTVAFGDEFMNLLVVVRKRCPGSFDHGADALVSFTKGVREIVRHEIGSVELRDPVKTALVPDDVGDLAHQPLVLLAHQLLRFRAPPELQYTDQPFAILISTKAAGKMKADPLSLSSSAVL